MLTLSRILGKCEAQKRNLFFTTHMSGKRRIGRGSKIGGMPTKSTSWGVKVETRAFPPHSPTPHGKVPSSEKLGIQDSNLIPAISQAPAMASSTVCAIPPKWRTRKEKKAWTASGRQTSQLQEEANGIDLGLPN